MRRYRDPVHNIIPLDESHPENRLIAALVDSAEFQRLRRVKQLGLAFVAFQGAEHSRFTHSLGVMHVMTRALEHLSAEVFIGNEVRTAARAAALLHDLGHGPFSHVMEKVLRQHHEEWTTRILRDPSTEVHQILAAHDPTFPDTVARFIEGEFRPRFVAQLVSSQLDCDRLDYLLRDSLMTGVTYGRYDLEWVLSSLAADPTADRLYVRARGVLAVEEYLFSRHHMFRQVYFHHALRAAENMLVSIFRRAVTLAGDGELRFILPGSAVAKLLLGETLTTGEYLQLDDPEVLFHIKQWRAEPDPALSDLSDRFINRRLFKSLEITHLEPAAVKKLIGKLKKVFAKAGYDPKYYLLDDSAADVPYFGPYAPDAPEKHLMVESGRRNPELSEISKLSSTIRGLQRYEIRRLCFPSEMREAVLALVEG